MRGNRRFRPARISIHAPPRGATITIDYVSGIIPISIHAPPRGATIALSTASRVQSFQFTPLREGRHRRHASRQPRDVISIHAPPRGATCRGRCSARADGIFQFTPLREGRRYFETVPHKATKFQFTPLREGRRKGVGVHGFFLLFQFTPLREGRRAVRAG